MFVMSVALQQQISAASIVCATYVCRVGHTASREAVNVNFV